MENLSKHEGPQQSTPYPRSRLSPPISALNLLPSTPALATITTNLEVKLQLIGDQIKRLQSLGEKLIMEAQKNIDLHAIPCSMNKKPGDVYHLYERDDQSQFLSIISPEEWGNMFNLKFLGSYKLESDMSWFSLEEKT
jgi:hypothetical protein